jgi:methylated-DNA-protein-cysteine methyltransferase related protein
MRRPRAPFTTRAVQVIRAIPRGKVASYGQVAILAGSPHGARQVVRVLHALSRVEKLPWQRIVSSRGTISLPRGGGFEQQRRLLRTEGVSVSADGSIDLERYRWSPRLDEAG